MSLPVCKFYYSNQKCRFGEHCKYLHSVNKKPPPSSCKSHDGKPVEENRPTATHSLPVEISGHSENPSHEDLVEPLAAASLNPLVTSFYPRQVEDSIAKNHAALKEQQSDKKQSGPQRKICQYFAQHGNCAFGRRCRFSHANPNQPDQSNQVHKSHFKSRDLPPRFQRQRRETAPFSNVPDGNLKEETDDLNCSQDKAPPKPKVKSGPRPCYLFKYGRCKWGNKCKFSHSKEHGEKLVGIPLSRSSQDENQTQGGENELLASDEKGNSSAISNKQRNECKHVTGNGPRPEALKQVLTLDELEKEGIERYRQLDINYLKRRFPKSSSKVVEDVSTSFTFHAKFSPSDPDWLFDITDFHLEFTLSGLYPREVMKVNVRNEEDYPETVQRYLQVSISEWLEDRKVAFADKGQVELVARPFLRWLDRNIEEIITEALKQLKRELIAKASGLEFIPAEKLHERYTSESGHVDNEESDGEGEGSETEDSSEGDSEDDSYSNDGSEEDEKIGPSLNLDPEMRGTEIALHNLQLKEKATSLLFERLKLILQCSRCKNHEDVTINPGKILSVICGKCSHEMLATYRASLAHQFSSVIGYLDLENCTAFDLIFQDCRASVSCMNCSKQTRIDGLVSGQLIDGWCQACNARFKIATDAVKFSHLSPSGIDNSAKAQLEVINKKPKKAPKDPQIKEGCPLPDFGTCKHYKHSYRWLRFPCCGKAYPCDVCHDKKEDHDMVFATRMICGHCCKEQPFAATRPCSVCKANLTRVHTAHWEGGSGCRDKISMSKSDIQKYKNMNKTVSNHKKKVQAGGSKKKTTKLRHA